MRTLRLSLVVFFMLTSIQMDAGIVTDLLRKLTAKGKINPAFKIMVGGAICSGLYTMKNSLISNPRQIEAVTEGCQVCRQVLWKFQKVDMEGREEDKLIADVKVRKGVAEESEKDLKEILELCKDRTQRVNTYKEGKLSFQDRYHLAQHDKQIISRIQDMNPRLFFSYQFLAKTKNSSDGEKID